MALKRRLWGIRQKIPQGFYLGRLSEGDGDIELLTADEITGSAGLNVPTLPIDLTSDVTGELPVADGGTGSSTAGGARTALGLVIGSAVQAWNTFLDTIAGQGEIREADLSAALQTKVNNSVAAKLNATAPPTANDDSANTSGNGTFSEGSFWIDVTNDEAYRCVDDTATAAVWIRTTLTTSDLGTLATQNANAVNISGGVIAGITDLAVADGGTGASTAANARSNLGVDAAGTDNSTDISLAGTPDYLTLAGQVLTLEKIDLTQDVQDNLPIADGGTGSSSEAGARANLGLGTAAVKNTGTSGDTVPLLNAVNTFSSVLKVDNRLEAFTFRSFITGNISDNAVFVLDVGSGSSFGAGMMIIRGNLVDDANGVIEIRCGTNTGIDKLVGSGTLDVTTGILSGTTGVNGQITVSVHTDEKIYIENRKGGTRAFSVSLFNWSGDNPIIL